MKPQKKYLELVIFKGDLTQDGAILRMNQMKILMQAAAELRGLQYQEDSGSYAIFGPKDKICEGEDMAKAFRKKVLTKVDICVQYGPELMTKTQTVIKMAQENEVSCGADLIRMLAEEMLMQNLFSLKEWSV